MKRNARPRKHDSYLGWRVVWREIIAQAGYKQSCAINNRPLKHPHPHSDCLLGALRKEQKAEVDYPQNAMRYMELCSRDKYFT